MRRIVIVGGGIAGLATAWHLARDRAGSVVVLEREPLLASHSSARNAAIFQLLEELPGMIGLAERTRAHLDGLVGRGDGGWLRRTGELFVAQAEGELSELAALAREVEIEHAALDGAEVVKRVPALAGGATRAGLFIREAGVVDIHAVAARLAEAARAAGARLEVGRDVARVRVRGGRVEGVELAGGEVVPADAVVLAPGAWAADLGTACGAPLPLVPLRRHLAQLDAPAPVDPRGPVVWALGDECYFRPESGGVLASPCDEAPWPPSLPPADSRALDLLARKLEAVAPPLGEATVRRAWACLRTFAPDRVVVAGADARIDGLFWLAGLGGSGMTVGVGAGEVVAALVAGREHPLAAVLSPARALPPPAALGEFQTA